MAKTIFWFRKSLRLHDNPALLQAIKESEVVFPVFIIDPWFIANSKTGVNRMNFLLESLNDLQTSLEQLNSVLFVLQGTPNDVFPQLFEKWQVSRLCFQKDTEPYALRRDKMIQQICRNSNIKIQSTWGHTLYNLDRIIAVNQGQVPQSYQGFLNILQSAGAPNQATPIIQQTPSLQKASQFYKLSFYQNNQEQLFKDFSVPTLIQLGFKQQVPTAPFKGGETEGLQRLNQYMLNTQKVCGFSKPDTDPTDLDLQNRSTSILSPYLQFGCLSSRLFYDELNRVLSKKQNHTNPPVSLLGQLYWREYFYTVAYQTPNFDQMEGNSVCRKIPWNSVDPKINPKSHQDLEAWRDGKTGYPWIDAIMRQLQIEGWIHHLARHCVACFLTRGDLYISWQEGARVFDQLLLDADWSLNNANWIWVSASGFYHQYYRVYSPIAFPKKYQNHASFIQHFVRELKDIPDEYIVEPWLMPTHVQTKSQCVIGVNYPKPIVAHDIIYKENIQKMKQAYNTPSNQLISSDEESQIKDQKSSDQKAQTQKNRAQSLPAPKPEEKDKNKKLLTLQQFIESHQTQTKPYAEQIEVLEPEINQDNDALIKKEGKNKRNYQQFQADNNLIENESKLTQKTNQKNKEQ